MRDVQLLRQSIADSSLISELNETLDGYVTLVMRLCRFPCGKPLAFRWASNSFAARPPRQSLTLLLRANGKPEAFRKGGGKAASSKPLRKRSLAKRPHSIHCNYLSLTLHQTLRWQCWL